MRKGIGECRAITLTTGLDNVAGTSGNDTISGAVNINNTGTSTVNSFSAADVINGGNGVDTLNVIIENANTGGANLNLPAAAISNVEIFNFRNVENQNAQLTVNAANFAGETEVNADRSSAAVVIQNLGTGAAAGIIGNGTGGNGALNFGYATASAAATLNVRDGAGVTAQPAVTITTAPTAVTINSTGAANSLGAVALGGAATSLTIDAATALSTGGFTGLAATGATITVKGAASGVSSPNAVPAAATVTLGNIQGGVNLTSIDASGLTAGGVQVGMNAASTNLQFKGGAGNDNVTTNGGTALLSTASIDAGAGTADRLVVANTNDITVAGTPLSKARGDLYKGFEQVQVQNGVSVDLDLLSTNNTINAVRLNDTGGTAGVTNLSAAGAQNVTVLAANGGVTIGVKGATTTGQIDTVKAALQTTTAAQAANAINLTNVTLSGVENLELTGSNGTLAANVGAVTLTTANAVDLGSIKLNNANTIDATLTTNPGGYGRAAGAGDNVITVAGAQRAINLSIDATGSGDTQINAQAYNTATGAALTGGAGNDLIQGSRNADVIKGGAGNDVLQGDVTGAAVAGSNGTTTINFNTLAATIPVGGTMTAYDATVNGVAYNNAAAANANAAALDLAGKLVTAGLTASANAGVVTITSAVGANAIAVTNLVADYNPATSNVAATVGGATNFVPAVAAQDRVFDIDVTAANTSGADAFLNITLNGVTIDGTAALATGGTVTDVRNAILTAIDSGTFGTISAAETTVAIVDADTVRVTISNADNANYAINPTITFDDASGAGGNAVLAPAATVSNASGGAAAVAASETLQLHAYTPVAAGNLVVTVDGVATANIAGTAGNAITADTIADALRTADATITAGGGADLFVDTDTGNGTLLFNTANGTAPVIAAVYTPANTSTASAHAGAVNLVNGTAAGVQTLFGADTLTGGEGNDVFVIDGNGTRASDGANFSNGSTFITMDTITDLNLGGSSAASQVDVIDLTSIGNIVTAQLVNAGVTTALNAGAANLVAAVNGLYTAGGVFAAGNLGAGIFTYGGDSYLIVESGDGATFGANDVIVKITGVTGTLDASDLL